MSDVSLDSYQDVAIAKKCMKSQRQDLNININYKKYHT
jgi:hypothetical protein